MANFIVSDALGRIAPSPTIAISQKARDLKAAGRDVIALAAGEPDFPTPEHIAEAGIQAIRDGKTGYTAVDGIPELKQAVAEKFRRDNDLAYDPASEVAVTSGGKFMIYAAMVASLNPGDEVIIPAPYWVSYPGIVSLCGGKPVIAKTSEEQCFKLTAEALEAAITDKTRWLILNSPGNPTGAVMDREDLAALAEVLERHPHVWVLTDDIYEHITYDAAFATIASVAPALKERTLTMNGASKAYSMTGWRIGFGGGPAPLMASIRKLLGQSTTNPCSISQWAAVAALNGDHSFMADRAAAFRGRRDMLLDAFSAMPGITCAKPEGAFYLYPSVAGLIGRSIDGRRLETDVDVCEALLERENVALVPGTAFGLAPFARLSYAASMEQLEEAASRMTRFCNAVAGS
ncbi:MAG: pyridoxal phosphate-dependent aminotransferase [Pseudomonadota bacterium]